MSTKAEVTKFFTVERLSKSSCYYGNSYETLEEAEAEARKNAWNSGETQLIMVPFAQVEAPQEINTTKLTKL